VSPVQARARQQLSSAAVQAGVHAISVVLDLVQPFRALRRRGHQLAKLWLDPLWKLGRMASRPIIHRFCYHNRARSVGIYTGGIVQEGSTCHGRVGEDTCASLWCPAPSTYCRRRHARNLFAYAGFGEQLPPAKRTIWGTRTEDQMPPTDRFRVSLRTTSRMSSPRLWNSAHSSIDVVVPIVIGILQSSTQRRSCRPIA